MNTCGHFYAHMEEFIQKYEGMKKMNSFTVGEQEWPRALWGWVGKWLFQIDDIFVFIIILMQEKHRNTQAQPLLPTPGNSDCVFLFRRMAASEGALEVRVSFCPAPCAPLDGHSPCFSVLPTFNRDHKFFTPSFLLPADMAKIQEKSSEFLDNHANKAREITEEKEELLVPKPSKANLFCLICKETYEDYLTHISYPSHNRLLRGSPFHADIQELCERISPAGNRKHNRKITKERKKAERTATPRLRKMVSHKSSEALSTGLQPSEEVQLCVSAK